MNVLELFAGIGGLSLGLERAGLAVIGQVEIDPFCRKVLAKHWPDVLRHDDVRTALDWWRSEPRPRVDVIAGGYPCQPESLAGKRKGTEDGRWLWPEFARLIHALRPRYVLGENVAGHRTGGLRFVLRDLEHLGYVARTGVVGASEMGAPHRRNRIFVLAADSGCTELWVEPGRCLWPYGQGASQPGLDGTPWHVAHAEREPGEARWTRDTEQGQGGRDADRGGISPDVANTSGEGRGQGGHQDGSCGVPEGSREQGLESIGRGWWAVEPDVGRVAYGVPARVDRLRSLGNAVVPQVGEFVGRLLLSGEWLAG